MWLEHWNLVRDPFAEDHWSYVATAGHEEAVIRLVHAVRSAQRGISLRSGAGLGKSTILRRALSQLRSPGRRVAYAQGMIDGLDLFRKLGAELGASSLAPVATRSDSWRRLEEAIRLCRWQNVDAVLAIDDCHLLRSREDRLDLERLDHLEADRRGGLTILRVGRPDDDESAQDASRDRWEIAARLKPLTVSETEQYLNRRLAESGRPESTFSARAVLTLHRLAGGVPRGLNQLASLALIAGAVQGLEMIGPRCVEEAAMECATLESH